MAGYSLYFLTFLGKRRRLCRLASVAKGRSEASQFWSCARVDTTDRVPTPPPTLQRGNKNKKKVFSEIEQTTRVMFTFVPYVDCVMVVVYVLPQ